MNSPDKLDILMNKLSQLEEAHKEEKRLRILHEKEIKNLKSVTIPNLQKIIEDKENLLKLSFVEKIKIERQYNSLVKKELETGNSTLCLNRIKVEPSLDKLSKLEYLDFAYKDLRNKFNQLLDDKKIKENEYQSKLDTEKEKSQILISQVENIESKFQKNIKEMKTLSDANYNLTIEIETLNSLLEENFKQKENILMTLNFYKSELEQVY